MKQVFVKGSYIQRDRRHVEVEEVRVRADQTFRDDRNQIGLSYHVQGLEIVRNDECDVSLVALQPKPGIQRIFGEFRTNDRNLPGFQEFFAIRDSARQRMAASRCYRIPVRKQALLIKSLEGVWNARDGQIHGARQLKGIRRASVAGLSSNGDSGRFSLQSFQQRRQQQVGRVVRQKQSESPGTARRLKLCADQQITRAREYILDRVTQSFPASRQLHSRADPYQ